ncbi:lymphocyte antigen 6E-like [Emydura macquarii macquarii]|uniref:lymphocyte antigen 6E-like n=1 Tax=Emydura macquarii macquarii TaxID=1129001 RepID=UPI00352A6D5B
MTLARSLKCYTCTTQPSNDQCMIPTDCADADKYCATVIEMKKDSSSGVMRITKLCLPMCSATSQQAGLGSSVTSCCQRDYCNRNRAAGVTLSYMTLGVGVLASFVYLLV